MNDIQASKPLALVVEDDASFRGVLSLLLETDGWQVAEAADGRSGLRLAESLEPRVIVTDLSMPQMSGIDLARALSENADSKRRLLALTSAGSGLEREARETGLFDRVMAKTISPGRLLGVVREMAGPTSEE